VVCLCVTGVWVYLAAKYLDLAVNPFSYVGLRDYKEWLKDFIVGFIAFSMVALAFNYLSTTRKCDSEMSFIQTFMWVLGWLAHSVHEELQFRGYIMMNLANKGLLYTMVASSFMFSMIHWFNPHITLMALVNLFIFGISLSLTRVQTGKIGMCIGMHFSWNFSLMWFGFPVSGVCFSPSKRRDHAQNEFEFGPEGELAFLGCNLIFILLFILYKRK